jgi:hypothetical protein
MDGWMDGWMDWWDDPEPEPEKEDRQQCDTTRFLCRSTDRQEEVDGKRT